MQEVTPTPDDIQTKGKILACEWLHNEASNESTQFAVGFAEGTLEIYKAESKSAKPAKILNFEITNLNQMTLCYQERGSADNAVLSVFYSQKDSMKIDANDSSHISLGGDVVGSQIFDKRKVFTSVIFYTGKKLEQRVYLEDYIDQDGR